MNRRLPQLYPITLCLLLGMGLSACASRPASTFDPKAHFEADFKKADADHDELLTREEVALGMPALAVRFEEVDLDKNEVLNFAEIWSYVQWRRVADTPPEKPGQARRN